MEENIKQGLIVVCFLSNRNWTLKR